MQTIEMKKLVEHMRNRHYHKNREQNKDDFYHTTVRSLKKSNESLVIDHHSIHVNWANILEALKKETEQRNIELYNELQESYGRIL